MTVIKRLIATVLVVCLMLGFIFLAGSCQSAEKLHNVPQDFDYAVKDKEIELRLTSGGVVRMRFGKNAVTIYESHLYKSDVYEIAAFICVYGAENGYAVSRKEREIAGEIKLHNLLYTIGYKRENTENADVEYTSDKRWYVNAASVVLG